MQTLKINKISDISQLQSQPSHKIANANWPQFGPAPETSFKIARLGDSICIEFFVREANPRAVNRNDQEPVWEDSCVEFFVSDADDPHYLNFEFNSLGACVSSRRLGRKEDVKKLSAEQLAKIKRTPAVKPGHWTLLVEIPLELITANNPAELRCNFYKCGDRTEHPHFLSWAPISLPSPDFHCPAFFGTATF